MCKHVAAVLYGIGARLDRQPDLLFLLRKVDHQELIAQAGLGTPRTRGTGLKGKRLEEGDLSAMFGIDIASSPRGRRPRSLTTGESKKAPPGRNRTKEQSVLPRGSRRRR
jgi:hypothetical protein